MIHPDTEVRYVSPSIGYGVFATSRIRKGTIVYVKDELEIEIDQDKFQQLNSISQAIVEKYSYIDQKGIRIVSWDGAKYVNHRCECNTISTGYGFEIAIKDIEIDEEIVDEYGLFNIPVPIKINCGCCNCRKVLLPDDIDRHYLTWDLWVMDALQHLSSVAQPLWHVIDVATKTELMEYLAGNKAYLSVFNLKWHCPEPVVSAN